MRPLHRTALALCLPLALVACRKHGSTKKVHDDPSADAGGEEPGGSGKGSATVAPTDRSPAKKPPPLKTAHLKLPALPDLPALEKQERGDEPPRDARLNDEPCRAVWTGSANASLTCEKALHFGSSKEAGATLLVPRKLLARSPERLPQVVDHRVEGTEGAIRNQETTPACTAFAEAAALDHALARWSGKSPETSVMQIWSRYHSPTEEPALTKNVTHLIGDEHEWPFSEEEANKWVPCEMKSKSHRGSGECGKKVDTGKAKKVEETAIGEFTEVEYLGKPDVTVLEAKIAAGQDIIVALEVPTALTTKGKRGARYVPDYTRSGGKGAGHAFVLAGYANYPHGSYFLVHNSWGKKWGDEGYAWFHMATLTRWARELVAVDAEPVDRVPGKRPRRVRGTETCEGGRVPDSIGGKCSDPCPDGSPRHDDVCATESQCPKNYVNLTGECVLAAPSGSGRDPETGISWKCGEGGCSYVLPKGVDAACTGATCQMSCPAPDFHVAKMGSSLVCIE